MNRKLLGAAAAAVFAFAAGAHAGTLNVLYSGAGGASNPFANSTTRVFEAEGRDMRSNNNTWTAGVGTNTQQAGQFAQSTSFNWANGVATAFVFSYDKDTGTATFSLDNGLNSVTLSYVVGNGYHNGFTIGLKARLSNGATAASGSIENLAFSLDNGPAQNFGSLSADNLTNGGLTDMVLGGSTDLSQHDWSITGTVTFAWVGGPPTNSFTEFVIKASEVPVVPVPAPVALAGLGLLGVIAVRRRMK